jgi:hypothetical protein
MAEQAGRFRDWKATPASSHGIAFVNPPDVKQIQECAVRSPKFLAERSAH